METVSDFIFLGSKINADSDCSHEIKKCLLFGRIAMTHLDSILKSRHVNISWVRDKGTASIVSISMLALISLALKSFMNGFMGPDGGLHTQWVAL